MPNALITGSSGFVGPHVCDAARAAQFAVAGLDRAGAPAVDLLRRDQVRAFVASVRPDLVIHLASVLRAEDPHEFYTANVLGTVNLLEALLAERLAPRVVIASSSAVYGNAAGGSGPIGEATELRPLTHYGASKAAQELAALRYHTAHGLPVVVARVFNITGPNQPRSLAAGSFAEQIARAEITGERRLRVGDLSSVRDFVDVRDVARAYLALASGGVPGAVYNVCSGVGVPVRRCLDELLVGARVPLRVEAGEAHAQAHDVGAQVGDGRRIARDAGWAPGISLERSMQDLLESWRMALAPERASGVK